jgi:hypothetical protein
MNKLVESIKNYFSKKEKGEDTGAAPEGMCPVCWGHSEWDGEYYELKKDKHLVPGSDVYESFISKIVDKHVATTHKHEDKYICTTCNKAI